MGRKSSLGLYKRGEVWHIDKQLRGLGRLCESTGESSLERAQEYLERRIGELRDTGGNRPRMKWRQAATKYLEEHWDKANIATEAGYLDQLDRFIGDLYLEQVHDATLKPYVDWRRDQEIRTKTIRNALGVVRHILNLCSGTWRHIECGRTWLEYASTISMPKPPMGLDDSRIAYPLDWNEQGRLIKALPAHLARMALFKVNTGCREDEVCSLRWAWEINMEIEEFKDRIFIIPGNVKLLGGSAVKNRQDRLIVLNDVAKSVVDECRGDHPEFVFTFRGNPVKSMNNTAWKWAWNDSGLPVDEKHKRGVHNLKHTYGRRLRAAGVSLETRQVLLGHKNGQITTHYSQPEIQELLDAVQKIAADNSRKSPALVILRNSSFQVKCA